VVAAEVRKLAERSQVAAQEIGTVASSSVELAEKAAKLLDEMVPSIKKTSVLGQEITAASQEQASGVGQISPRHGERDRPRVSLALLRHGRRHRKLDAHLGLSVGRLRNGRGHGHLRVAPVLPEDLAGETAKPSIACPTPVARHRRLTSGRRTCSGTMVCRSP
jgi:hypothetical protein